MRDRSIVRVVVSLTFFLLLDSLPALALPRTWIGGNVDWNDGGSTANWNPADEPDFDDEAIFNTANSVSLGTNNSIQALTLSGGIDLFTNGNDLIVDGTVSVTGASTTFFIDDSTTLVTADTVAVNAGGTIRLDEGTLTVDEETGTGFLDINAGGTFTGNGDVNFNDAPGVVTSLLINDGSLIAASFPTIVINPPPVGTLTLNANAANARINLDGGAESGVVSITRNQTLEINGALQDAFTGTIAMTHATTLDISTAWEIDGGALNVDNGFVNNPLPNPDIPASTATIAGGALTQSGGVVTVIDGDGTLIFDAAFTQTGGSFVNNGLVRFSADTLIDNTANFTMPTNTSSIAVGAGATVNVDQANFNVDGNGTATNVITIGSGGVLDLDLGAGADDSITGSVVLSGGELDVTTADNTWSLEGDIMATSGTSQLNGEQLFLTGAVVAVGANATLDVNAFSQWQIATSVDIAAGGLVTLDGDAFLANATATGDGTFRVNANSTAHNFVVGTNTFDWDGATAGHVHEIDAGESLQILSTNFDTDGDMDDNVILHGASTLLVQNSTQWIMEGIISTGDVGSPSSALITGNSQFINQGSMNVDGNTDINNVHTFGATSTTSIDAGVTLDSMNIAIFAGGILSGLGTYSPGAVNTVTASSSINVDNFDFDGGNWIVNNGATLTVNVTDYDVDAATNKFDATITLDGGDINMTTADAAFVMDGTFNMNAIGISVWTGESIAIGNDDSATIAQLNVAGVGVITAPVRFNSDADVNVSSGGTLTISDVASFSTVNGVDNATFTGGGTIIFNRQVNFTEATTFNMPGGEIDFDGSDLTANLINLDAPVTINAASVADFGEANNVGGLADFLDINNSPNSGSLTVNLDDPASEWTLNAAGEMNLTNDNSPATLLAGSDVNLNGTVNVTGDVRVTARVDIAGTVNIQTAGEPLRLSGGNESDDPNTLAGGIISGPGLLGADGGSALHGFGTINAGVDFDDTADLRADNGILTINGAILDVSILGTADVDGTLNIPAAWNTSANILAVDLKGGELRGGAITNDNITGIGGFGLVTSQVINNSQFDARQGTLVVQTAANNNDWDGATNTGQLNATTGDLEIRDNLPFDFFGSATISNNRELFVNGFSLHWEPGSSLALSGGSRYRVVGPGTNFGSTMTVAAGDPAEINAANFFFESTSNVTITGTLRLNTAATQIDAGATFSGNGTLLVPPTSANLRLQDGADVDVLIENQGRLLIAQDAAGQATGLDYQQGPSGRWFVELAGTGLNDFDRLNLTGAAQLAGILDLDLLGGFVPALGDEFNILSANGGINGVFTIQQLSGLPPGLFFNVRYESTVVQLVVTDSLPGDYNRDNVVDAADVLTWRKAFGTAVADFAGADGNGDGFVDDDDYGVWRRNFGTTSPPGAGSGQVPEPSALTLFAFILASSTFARAAPRLRFS